MSDEARNEDARTMPCSTGQQQQIHPKPHQQQPCIDSRSGPPAGALSVNVASSGDDDDHLAGLCMCERALTQALFNYFSTTKYVLTKILMMLFCKRERYSSKQVYDVIVVVIAWPVSKHSCTVLRGTPGAVSRLRVRVIDRYLLCTIKRPSKW